MRIRDVLNKNTWVVAVCVVAIVIIAIWTAIGQFTGGGAYGSSGHAFYTVDDGQTYFADARDRLAPFESGGKTAYRAIVYRCEGGKPFVAFMEKYTDKTKQLLETAMRLPKGQTPDNVAELRDASVNGKLMKKPGDKAWSKSADIMKPGVPVPVVCPGGSKPEHVTP